MHLTIYLLNSVNSIVSKRITAKHSHTRLVFYWKKVLFNVSDLALRNLKNY